MVTSPLSKRQSRKSVKEFRPKPYKEKAKSSDEISKEENFVIDSVPGNHVLVKMSEFMRFKQHYMHIRDVSHSMAYMNH